MTRRIRWGALLCVLVLGGCAHPISLAPDLAKLDAQGGATKAGIVGLYVSAEDRGREVVTPGGGGDKVSYYPYRDLEAGIFKVLGNVYERVVLVPSPTDLDALAKGGVSLVARPRITTQSSSDSIVTWPPTFFQVQIVCMITDIGGNRIAEPFVTGVGRAEFAEFKSDLSLSAKRASEDVLRQLQNAIAAEKALK